MSLDNAPRVTDIDAPAANAGPAWTGIVDAVRSMPYGSTIETRALYVACGMEHDTRREQGESDRRFLRRRDRARLAFAAALDSARDVLLSVHSRDLRSTKPGEYTLVMPAEQADTAQRDALRDARRALASGAKRAASVNATLLSDAERRRAVDVEAHMDSLRSMMRRKK